jgi:hypothetical protein
MALTFAGLALAQTNPAEKKALASTAPIIIEGPEQASLVLTVPDGGLAPVLGVQNFEVFRAGPDAPDLPVGKGYTYNHHLDMACWKGVIYLAWESGEKDEDTWPAHELYCTSADAIHWSAPRELFPEGISTPLRMYFFHAPNGRMLAIAGLRLNHEKTTAETIGPLVVREILSDHSLGDVFTLQGEKDGAPPRYETSPNAGFVQACRQLLDDKTFLATQDFGKLLNDGKGLGKNPLFGKATCFFRRADGELIGIAKKGLTMVSTNDGKTWTKPYIPPTLITGMAKVWAQHTADGKYALVYNPQTKERFPLVVVNGKDGRTFKDMRVVHAELPPLRYLGAHKNTGAQYTRGISEWANDGSIAFDALWVAYSVNKEDIWISRIPLPPDAAPTIPTAGEFNLAEGTEIPGWNTYCPKWASIEVPPAQNPPDARFLQIQDSDPYDHARAQRMFPPAGKIVLRFSVRGSQTNHGQLQIELLGQSDLSTPIKLTLGPSPDIQPAANNWSSITVRADCQTRKYSVEIEEKPLITNADFTPPPGGLQRLSFRSFASPQTKPASPAPPDTDKRAETVTYDIGGIDIIP